MKNRYELRGDVTAIFLDRRDGTVLETIIDNVDLPKAQEYGGKWYAHYSDLAKTFYVMGNTLTEEGKKSSIQLHRYLMDAEYGLVVDHINHDTLNNRRLSNLREVTTAQNSQNRKSARSDNSTGILGVSWIKRLKKYVAQVYVNGKQNHLGCFDNAIDAEKAVVKARKEMMPYSKEAI